MPYIRKSFPNRRFVMFFGGHGWGRALHKRRQKRRRLLRFWMRASYNNTLKRIVI